ncbi:MAG: hypothetical protein H0T39_11455 [Actinobacteria bacterium]|nr:hypothetical protein [Actinomycetota bacterium]
MDVLFAFFLPLALEAHEEGIRIITGMLLVGLTFVVVIALGELARWLGHRRRGRRRAHPYL